MLSVAPNLVIVLSVVLLNVVMMTALVSLGECLIVVDSKPTWVEHIMLAPSVGMHLSLPRNVRFAWKNLPRTKHPSLFLCSLSAKDIRFFAMKTPVINVKSFLSYLIQLNRLECLSLASFSRLLVILQNARFTLDEHLMMLCMGWLLSLSLNC